MIDVNDDLTIVPDIFEKQNMKRPCSEKQRLHLERCREKSKQVAEKRRLLEREDVKRREREANKEEEDDSMPEECLHHIVHVEKETKQPSAPRPPTPPPRISQEEKEIQQFEKWMRNHDIYKNLKSNQQKKVGQERAAHAAAQAEVEKKARALADEERVRNLPPIVETPYKSQRKGGSRRKVYDPMGRIIN